MTARTNVSAWAKRRRRRRWPPETVETAIDAAAPETEPDRPLAEALKNALAKRAEPEEQ